MKRKKPNGIKKKTLKNQNKQLSEEIIQKNQEIKMLKKTIKKMKTAASSAKDLAAIAVVSTVPAVEIEDNNKCCLCNHLFYNAAALEIHIDRIHSDIFRNPIKL